LLECRGFTEEDFAQSHPSGSLGKRLVLRVEDVMRVGDEVPMVGPQMSLGAGLVEMTRKGLGMTAVVDQGRRVLGIFTDGDLRRALDTGIDVHATDMQTVMHKGCITARPDTMAAAAVHILEDKKITALLVTDANGILVGALNVHDLLRAGVM
jgi:arabinose-5-phosphate isomerase